MRTDPDLPNGTTQADLDRHADERTGEPEDECCDGSGYNPCWAGCDDGTVVTCIDDMCRGAGECMHGDGYGACRECKGTGYICCPVHGGDDD